MKTLPIFLAFFLMGLADAMGPLSDAVQKQYQLSNVLATLLPFFVFIAFALFSVPGGLLAARIGRKKLLLLGLGLTAVACLVTSLPIFQVMPNTGMPSFVVLLVCIFLLGVGTTFLQVAGNPIMRDVSAEGTYGRNLAFAQGIKGLGSAGSTYLVTALLTVLAGVAMLKGMEWRVAFPLFFVLMVVAIVGVAPMKVQETKADTPPSLGSSLGLLANPVFFLAVLGIFLYVGAEASMGRFLFPMLKGLGMDEKMAGFLGSTLFFLLITIGRLLGGAVLTVMTPRACFRLSALLGLLGAAAIMSGIQALAIAGVIAAGLGFANIWPMLFSITVEEKPEAANELSGLMCMAISGGAIVPLIMGQFVDMGMKVTKPAAAVAGTMAATAPTMIDYPSAMAFVVPAVCFAYLLLLSMKGGKKAAVPAAK